MSTKYELVWENGKTYPPKYVIAVANHLQNGAEIDVSGYNAVEAKNYLTAKGYEIQIKQTKYEITITSDSVPGHNQKRALYRTYWRWKDFCIQH